LAAVSRSNTVDELFVAAPRDRAFAALIDLGRDATWWPGADARRDDQRLRVDAPGFRAASSRVRFEARIDKVRPGEGFVWRIDRGEVHGRAEFWLEEFKDGTVVHYFLNADPGERGRARRWSSRVRRHRWAVRRGVNGLKDALEGR
jgi:hypothetical protein